MTSMANTILAIFLIADFVIGNICQPGKTEQPKWRHGKETRKEYLLDRAMPRNFHQSKEFCESLLKDSSLAMIKSDIEQEAVHGLISHLTFNFAWLGAKNPSDSAGRRYGTEFRWLDGTAISNTSYSNWWKKPIHNYDGFGIKSEDGKWINDDYNRPQLNTICERPLTLMQNHQLLLNEMQSLRESNEAKVEQLEVYIRSLKEEIRKQSIAFESKLRVIANGNEFKLNKLITKSDKSETQIKSGFQRQLLDRQLAENAAEKRALEMEQKMLTLQSVVDSIAKKLEL